MRPNKNLLFMRKFTYALLAMIFIQQTSDAQAIVSARPRHGKSIEYVTNVESNLLQFATIEQGNKAMTSIPRYTYFFNMGFDADFRTSRGTSLFTGLNMKNIGMIIKYNDSIREKHRVYTVGAPFGFKFHSANKKDIVFKAGADLSFGVNYKSKRFVNDKKTKQSEWFSNRTALFFPSLFAGLSVKGVSISANYYLNNFFNNLHPATLNWDARLFTVGFGLNMNNPKMKSKKSKAKSN